MPKSNSYFYSGAIAAVLMLAMLAGNSIFQTVFAGGGLGSLPRELRLGVDLGLLMPNQCNSGSLNRSVNRQNFAEKICLTFDLLGFQDASMKNLTHKGIFSHGGKNSTVTRKEALETLARACISLKEAGIISFPEADAASYRDYKVAEKYRSAVSYLQKKYVVRGFPDGSLGGSRRLTLRDSVFFIYRFYEAVSADLMGNREATGINFVDIPLSHPIMDAVKNMTTSGAFDKIILRPSFDGDSFITGTDMVELVNGIFARVNKEVDQIRMRTILTDHPGSSFAKRRQLALILEYILDSFAKDRLNASKINYTDVTIDDPEYESLVKLAGCGLTLGYGDGRFAAEDNLTWFETVSLLNEVIKFAHIVEQPEKKSDRLALKSDIEDLKTLLKAKREKIRQILKVEKVDENAAEAKVD